MSSDAENTFHEQPKNTVPTDPRSFIGALIADQLRIVHANEKAVTRGDVRALHDLRVAVRRIRTLLNTIGFYLNLKAAGKLEKRFKQLQKKLGPARDTDVLLRIIQEEITLDTERSKAEQEKVLAHLCKLRERYRKEVKKILTGNTYKKLKSDTLKFIKKDLQETEWDNDPSLKKIAEKSIHQALRRMKKRAHLTPDCPPKEVHRLRITARKARYLAEFFSPVLGTDMDTLALHLRNIQDALGDIHDLDVLIAGIQKEYTSLPKTLLKDLKNKRTVKTKVFFDVFTQESQHSLQFIVNPETN